MRARQLLVSLIFLGLLAAGWIYALGLLTAESWSNWQHGAAGQRIEQDLAKQSAWARQLQHGARLLGYLAWRDLGPDVYQGCPGWLFYAEEFTPPDWPSLDARLDAAARVQARLAKQGIRLLLLPVPDKARMQASALCGLRRPPALAGRYERLLAGMRQRGLEHFDVRQAWLDIPPDASLYYRTDTHWQPRASHEAAYALAARIGRDQPALAGISKPVPVNGAYVELEGDLLRLTRLADWRDLLAVGHEWVQRFDFPPVSGAAGLLDEPSPVAIMLIGSSYSHNAYFSDFLQAALDRPLGVLSRDGAGFHASMAEWLSNPAALDPPPRQVIWEFPERAMSSKPDAAEVRWMNALAQP